MSDNEKKGTHRPRNGRKLLINDAREARGENFSILLLNHTDFNWKLLIMRAQRAEKIFAFYMCAKRFELTGGTLNFWGAPRGERLIGGERLSLGTGPGGTLN